MPAESILVVDDEPRYLQLIALNLRASGFKVVTASTGATAIARVEHEMPSLIILDVMLPDLDGYEVCQRIREFSAVPIIMLTAKSEVVHKVTGLGAGADDYVTKPFSVDELIARIHAALRRRQRDQDQTPRTYEVAGLWIDFDGRRVLLDGAEVTLSALEFRLLERLAARPGRVVPASDLLRGVWGLGYEGADEALRTAVARLRRKIEPNPERPRFLLTSRGMGYSLRSPSEA